MVEVSPLVALNLGGRSIADTFQIVSWALERECPFRTGADWALPDRTREQLNSLRQVSNALAEESLVDGICVTGWSCSEFDDDPSVAFVVPEDGFLVEERLNDSGGLKAALKTCGTCDANVGRTLAGCHGHLMVEPHSREVDESLRRAVVDCGLEGDLAALFLTTTPLWYGLWAESPLSSAQLSLLTQVFDVAFEVEEKNRRGLGHFVAAADTAITNRIPIHVSLSPLGHSDLGWYTVFPHCPRCKANAPVGKWKEEFPKETCVCEVCGNSFVPNDTHSQEEHNWDPEVDSLEGSLGSEKYERFLTNFIIAQGFGRLRAENAARGEMQSRRKREELWKNRSQAQLASQGPPCPECGEPLKTDKAQQCFACGADWH